MPGRTSDPFAVHQVRKSHRQSGGDQGTPEGRQGVHPTPLQCTKSRACHAKATGRAADTKGHRRDTGAYIRSLCSAPSPAPVTPLQCTKSRACHAKATGRAAETKRHRRDARAFIRPLCSAPSPTPATQKPTGRAAETKGYRRDARAYIRPLCSAPSPAPATQKPPAERRRPRDTGGTLGRRPSLQCTKSRACHAKATGRAAETKGHRRDARAYIRPLYSAPSPAPATQKPPAERRTKGHRRDARASDPFAVHQIPRLPRAANTNRHRRDTGAYIRSLCSAPSPAPATPLQCTKSRACHAKATGRAAETKGHRRDARAYIRPLCSAPSPTPHAKATGRPAEKPRDTGGTPGRTSDPFAVHQVPGLLRKSHRQSGGDQGTPGGTQGVHPTPLQCTKPRACHAKATGRAAETKGHRRDARAYIRPLCSAPNFTCVMEKPPAERRRPRDTGGTPGRTSDPFAVHQSAYIDLLSSWLVHHFAFFTCRSALISTAIVCSQP